MKQKPKTSELTENVTVNSPIYKTESSLYATYNDEDGR
jgi:hypothetical protein